MGEEGGVSLGQRYIDSASAYCVCVCVCVRRGWWGREGGRGGGVVVDIFYSALASIQCIIVSLDCFTCSRVTVVVLYCCLYWRRDCSPQGRDPGS